MKVLAIDHGNARCGCAVCDPTGTIVRPLEVIPSPAVAAITSLAERERAERFVVGLPVGLDGTEREQAATVRAFAAELEAASGLTVELWDERLTTVMAGASRRAGARAAEDSLAAAHLLQSYLDAEESRRARGQADRVAEGEGVGGL